MNADQNMNAEQKRRYSRQIAIGGFGQEAQEKLLQASVGIIGCGALGSMIAMQLAGAGVGKLTIGDFDTVDISNLQRQFFFSTDDAGQSKCKILARRISELNPEVETIAVNSMITSGNVKELFSHCSVLIDATDNPSSKAMVEKAAAELGVWCSIGGVSEFHGQVLTLSPQRGSGFTDIFNNPQEAEFLPCSLGGVAGPAAALCGSIQASEAMKIITGYGETLQSQILIFDLIHNRFETFVI